MGLLADNYEEDFLKIFEMILFYLSDQEILDLSEVKAWSTCYTRILDQLNLELRLLVLIVPLDDFVAIVPTYYLESVICRDLILHNIAFLEAGYVRLLMSERDLTEFISKKQQRYQRVKNVEKYMAAYYSGKDYGLRMLPFILTTKIGSIGETSLQLWQRSTKKIACHIRYPEDRLEELLKRVQKTEREAFLWESVKTHLDRLNFGKKEERLLNIRIGMSASYLHAYRKQGVQLPSGSFVVSDALVVGKIKSRAYDLLNLRRILEMINIFFYVSKFDAKKMLVFKSIPCVVYAMEKIRNLLDKGYNLEEILRSLEQAKLVKDLQKAARGIYYGGEGMKSEPLERFKKDHPGQTAVVIMTLPKGRPETKIADKKLNDLFECIEKRLLKYGIKAVRADKKNYSVSDWLWENVRIYLDGADFGIAVLENLFEEEINPNITLEYGYMLGRNKRVLLLKEKGFTKIKTDILGKLWKEFEFDDLQTVAKAIDDWMVDLEIHPIEYLF